MTSRTSCWTVLLCVLALTACSDGGTQPQRATRLTLVQAPSAGSHSAEPLAQQPMLQLVDELGNVVARAGVNVSAQLEAGAGTISNATVATGSDGMARFTALSIAGPLGAYAIRFTAGDVASPDNATVTLEAPLCETGGVPLDMPLGGFQRFITSQPTTPKCLEFHASQNGGQQYAVMFENMPRNGAFANALFPVTAGSSTSPSELTVSVAAAPTDAAASVAMSRALSRARLITVRTSSATSATGAEWDFSAGVLREGHPADPPSGAAHSVILHSNTHANGTQLELRSPVPAVGDTIQVYLEGISRLNIEPGEQKALVRRVTSHLVFAEDVRLSTTLLRTNGANNRPLTDAQMDTISAEYDAYARVQADRFFMGRFNAATEAQASHVTAVHTLMYADNIWGYTYPYADYLAFDYWVGTDGSTAGNNQILQRVADDLFMHEIAHIRHGGMLERASRTGTRGNQWLTEGFARFTERMPIAMRLLGTTVPSRTSDFVLAYNPIFNRAYFFDDVPTYLYADSSAFSGYQSSSYVFDYIEDQVAARGGDYEAAARDILVNGGAEADVDAAVARWFPGWTFGELYTRARIALYTDNYAPGMPTWTQYGQYQLRASRPPGSKIAMDPRNAWPKLAPNAVFAENRSIPPGGAFGYIIDGTGVSVNSRIVVSGTAASNGVMSITRIR